MVMDMLHFCREKDQTRASYQALPASDPDLPKSRTLLKKRRGDTIVEIIFCFTIFSLVTIISIGLMNRNLALVQGTLEVSMARNEIEAQAEAIRFIHNSFLSERELVRDQNVDPTKWQEYRDLWERLAHTQNGLNNNPVRISKYNEQSCSQYYDPANTSSDVHNLFTDKAFVINTRKLDPKNPDRTIISARDNQNLFKETSLFPRLVFSNSSRVGESGSGNSSGNLNELQTGDNAYLAPIYNTPYKVEGIWVIGTRDMTEISNPVVVDDSTLDQHAPEYYDFHIRTCWYGPGRNIPSTISTIIRLYNPEFVKKD